GNPEKPATMGYIVKAIEGMAEACRALDFPVVSGNVSLYNETDGVAIPPTPVVGGVGLIEDVSKVATLKGAQDGDLAFMIGPLGSQLGASLYAREILSLKGSDLCAPPMVDLQRTVRTATEIRRLVATGRVSAVHDVSDGGLACAMTEMSLAAGLGAEIFAPADNTPAYLFGEDHDRYLVAVSPDQEEIFRAELTEAGMEVTQVGRFTENVVTFKVVGESEQRLPLATLRKAHEGWLPTYMDSVD
ncbi:MAG: AIR synthase-related protein, partial [Roseibium sp.]